MKAKFFMPFIIMVSVCGFVFADNWQLYENFEATVIDTAKWVISNDYGGDLPFVDGGVCVLSGIDTDGTTEANNWEDSAQSTIESTVLSKAVKCDIDVVSVQFNNDPLQGEVADFEMSFEVVLSNNKYCSILFFDTGEGLTGNALIEDEIGNEITAASFSAAYSSASAYSVEIHDYTIMLKKGDSLILSWTDSEEISISQFSLSAVGAFCQYEVNADEVYVSDDPDYGNNAETAKVITPDSTTYYGTLETSSDEDWFVFTKSANNRYRFNFLNADYNWKYMKIYQENEFGDLIEQKSISSYYSYGTTVTTLFFEPAYKCYLKVYSAAGNYSLRVDYLDTIAPDAYGDSCSNTTLLNVGDSAIVGTLDHVDPDNFKNDWFEFDTQAFHKYQIVLTRSDNSDLYFNLYKGGCGDYIDDASSTFDLVSWADETYSLQINGASNKIGHYYTLDIVDMGVVSDDYGNTKETAEVITADGQDVSGTLQYNTVNYHNDEDWFVFSKNQYGRYQFVLTNPDSNWKYMTIYQEDEFGNIVSQRTISAYVSYGSSSTTVFFQPAYRCFIRVYNASGEYSINVTLLDTTEPDTYGKSCSEPTQLIVDAEPVVGTLYETTGDFGNDWFYFQTQAMHEYQITLLKADSSNCDFELYNENCGGYINDGTSYDIISWFGEDYGLKIVGSSTEIGHYYTIKVEDMGLQPDDYPNVYSLAVNQPKDGSWIDGVINYSVNYHSDVDWMKFTAGMDGDYTFQFKNIDYNWKYMKIYRVNELGEPVELDTISSNLSYGISSVTLALTAGVHYVRVYNELGEYQVSILSPEPRCGDLDHPYPAGDVNEDCYFDINDFSMMAIGWLSCTSPEPPCNFVPNPQ